MKGVAHGRRAPAARQSLIQDDRELLGEAGTDPVAAMAEIRSLGVDIVRTNVIHQRIYTSPRDRRKPRGFNASNPNSSKYDWAATDRLVQLARANGIRVLMSVTGPGPFFSSSSPGRCRSVPCSYRPKPSELGAFAAAVAKRYRSKVDYYSIWNEPNIGKTWLTPRYQRTRYGRVDAAGALYRKLLRAALCLDPQGRPFTGRLRELHGCSGRVRKLNVGGFAVHPWNQGAYGSPRTATRTKTSLPLAYMPRLHRQMDGAARRGRIGRGKGIWVTEFGYQTKPPDPFGISLNAQAQSINESDRLFFSDRRVRSVAQYELADVPETNQFNTGLRFARSRTGQPKPAYAAYRMPIVVTRRAANSVEVYGQVRPARLLPGGPVIRPLVQVSEGGGPFVTVAAPTINRRGLFRINVNRDGAANSRWRLVSGSLTSRVGSAGRPLRYRRG